MPSQIKVDEIKNVAGQYKIKTDTFEGQSTANNMTINAGNITLKGENTNTTNLQQGLAKVWAQVTVSAVSDSQNVSGLTDHSAGTFTFTYTNNMANQTYSFQHLPCELGSRQLEVYMEQTADIATSSIKVYYGYTSNTNGGITMHDHNLSSFAHHGDLA